MGASRHCRNGVAGRRQVISSQGADWCAGTDAGKVGDGLEGVRWARPMLKVLVVICIFLGCLYGAQSPKFEVVSIHPHAPDDSTFRVTMLSNGQFTATGSAAKLVLMLAYNIQEAQVVGGPSWLATEKWDIEAQSGDDVMHSAEETRQMLQAMLEERFALRIHRATEQRPAYVLTVAKGGPKFKAVEHEGSTNYRITRNSITLQRGDVERLAQILSTALGRPVIDRTGLSGLYDLSVQWDDAPIREGGVPGLDVPATPGNDHGSIFTAIQDQLGLRLESQRAPVEVIVIDRIDTPSEN